jgi:hypothetical protein
MTEQVRDQGFRHGADSIRTPIEPTRRQTRFNAAVTVKER